MKSLRMRTNEEVRRDNDQDLDWFGNGKGMMGLVKVVMKGQRREKESLSG